MHAAPTSNLGREFDAFLFAPIGEDANGMMLSVVSVLARLNIDPWREASEMAKLPREPAIAHLASLLRKTTDALDGQQDPMVIARRVVPLLPPKDQPSAQSRGTRVLNRSPLALALMYVVFVSLVVGGQYFLMSITPPPTATGGMPVDPAQPPQPDHNAANH